MKGLQTPAIPVFKRKIVMERFFYKRPDVNVIMVTRVSGTLDKSKLRDTLDRLIVRHPLLLSRITEDNGESYFTNDCVTTHDVMEVTRDIPYEDDIASESNGRFWVHFIQEELKHKFDFRNGPLIRFIIIRYPEQFLLIVNGQHSVCDGKSLLYLLHDLFEYMDTPISNIPVLEVPPILGSESYPDFTPGLMTRLIIRLLNFLWKRQGIRLEEDDFSRLHEVYWNTQTDVRFLMRSKEPSFTKKLVSRCREEGVTVNTALVTSFLKATSELQDMGQSHLKTFRLPVEVRDRFPKPIDETLALFASTMDIDFEYDSIYSFWENARLLHERIQLNLSGHNLDRFLAFEDLSPSLLDAMYFQKYGMLENWLVKFMLKRLGISDLQSGILITNLGRFPYPLRYNSHTIQEIYGPCVHGTPIEKLVGITTTGGRMTLTISYKEEYISTTTVENIVNRVFEILE